MESLNKFLVLEALRVRNETIPYPIIGPWAYLADVVEELHLEDMLILQDDCYELSSDGKKAILLFNLEKKEILSSLEVYKEIKVGDKVIDGRIPICAFKVRKQKPELSEDFLKNMAVFVAWGDFFNEIKHVPQNLLWQKVLVKKFNERISALANRYCWRVLGRDLNDAVITCERLLNPIPTKDLINLTRN